MTCKICRSEKVISQETVDVCKTRKVMKLQYIRVEGSRLAEAMGVQTYQCADCRAKFAVRIGEIS